MGGQPAALMPRRALASGSRARRTLAAALGVAAALGASAPAARAGANTVDVFPSPGTRHNQPQTQITFRGVPASQIGQVTVTGSESGVHTGTVEADSDGDGGSFLPANPFAPGETVTVTTGLNVLGGNQGSFTFAIANPAGPIGYGALPLVSSVRGGVQSYRSAPGLRPATVDVTTDRAPVSQGDIFVAPQFGPAQNGPMILDPHGKLIWFLPTPVKEERLITDFRVQQLYGQPVLTWWQGNTNLGHGRGEGEIYDRHYQPLATVKAGNGLDMDLHEFLIRNEGDAYFLAAWRVRVPGVKLPLVDAVVQEVDIKTGLVLFQWDALDHIPLRQSYFRASQTGRDYDPYHANSVSLDTDGNVIVSMRNTSAEYKVNHESGRVMWTLGGKASSFKMGRGTSSWGQHDALDHPGQQMTVFDDGGAPPRVHPHSRGIRVGLNLRSKRVTLIREYDHAPQLATAFEGSLQPLSQGDVFLGWGQQPYFSEDNASGRQIFDAHFAEPAASYRAYRFPWTGDPPTSQLGVAVTAARGGKVDVFASWNGATGVSSWRALGGSSPTALAPVGAAVRRGFETKLRVRGGLSFYAVQALGPGNAVLGTSPAVPAPVRR